MQRRSVREVTRRHWSAWRHQRSASAAGATAAAASDRGGAVTDARAGSAAPSRRRRGRRHRREQGHVPVLPGTSGAAAAVGLICLQELLQAPISHHEGSSRSLVLAFLFDTLKALPSAGFAHEFKGDRGKELWVGLPSTGYAFNERIGRRSWPLQVLLQRLVKCCLGEPLRSRTCANGLISSGVRLGLLRHVLRGLTGGKSPGVANGLRNNCTSVAGIILSGVPRGRGLRRDVSPRILELLARVQRPRCQWLSQ
mmetsp:Transcript_155983/g.500161  ORF Transcript_155983/g.500161 Transcript_155983/m.500161 type:complete len:254 (-) Transcript_155983:1232-1993(-)